MTQVKWFDRKFDFSSNQNVFPSIIERLDGTMIRMEYKINQIPVEQLTIKKDEKWSIQEHIGHLIDLEPLWQGRLEDVLEGNKYLRSTDLENRQTDLARHNEKNIKDLLLSFTELRIKTLDSIRSLSEDDIYKYALHPRLETPMRAMDLFLFVAEHDDHHVAAISDINRMLST